MGKDVHRIALDSMSLTYVVEAFHAIDGPPVAPCKDEKLALYRIYIYLPITFNICPTVEVEFQRIRDDAKRALHQSWCDTLFMTFVPAPDIMLVRERALELSEGQPNSKHFDDCSILAECELAGMKVLLTYDDRILNNLALRSTGVRVLRPTEYWTGLGIPPGARPDKVPRWDNSMSAVSWWRW